MKNLFDFLIVIVVIFTINFDSTCILKMKKEQIKFSILPYTIDQQT